MAHECSVHYDPRSHGALVNERPDYDSSEAWHADAIGDSGVSHTLVGRRYVVACQWCRCVFIAESKNRTMAMFRDHETEMLKGSR